jgi:hypothetical protein
MKKSELRQIIKEAINKFSRDASLERLEQVKYVFKFDKNIVSKINELISLIKDYK